MIPGGSMGWSLKDRAPGSWCFQMRPVFLWVTTTFQKMVKEKNSLGRPLLEMKRDITSMLVEESLRMNFVKCETIVMPNWLSPSWLYLPSRWISGPVAFLNQMPMDMWPCLCQSTSWAIPVHWTHKMHNPKKKCRAGSGHRVIKIKVSNFFLFYVLKIATKLPALSGKCEQPSHGKCLLLDWFLKPFLSNYLQSPG